MSRFYGTLGGMSKTQATRRGSTNNPCCCHVRGWDIGGYVEAKVGQDDSDIVYFEATSGSNGGGRDQHLLTIARRADGEIIIIGVSEWLIEQVKDL